MRAQREYANLKLVQLTVLPLTVYRHYSANNIVVSKENFSYKS